MPAYWLKISVPSLPTDTAPASPAATGTHGSTVNVSVTAVDVKPLYTPSTFAVYVVPPVSPVNVYPAADCAAVTVYGQSTIVVPAAFRSVTS